MAETRAKEGEGHSELDVLLHTERTFPPPPEFVAQAHANDPDVDEHRARLNDTSERRLVGRMHLSADQVVGIVLQARHEESELTTAPRWRPPGELRDRRAMGARRLRERREADVERMDAGVKDAGAHGHTLRP